MDVIPIQITEQEVIIPLTYFPKSSELELVVKGDVAIVRVKSRLPRLHQNERRAEMLAQTAVFEAQLETLQQTYLDEYVAFHGGELVDHDPDHKELMRRIDRCFPNEVVLIRQVTADPPTLLKPGSPHLVC